VVRTQVQLTEDQALALKQLAAERGVSIAELVRIGVEHVLVSARLVDPESQRQRALAVAGRFHSGLSDLSTDHDRYLAETGDA
jgi:hypothetical protein